MGSERMDEPGGGGVNEERLRERLDYAHERVYRHYQWFAGIAPGVTPVEEGDLKRWWQEIDMLTPLVGDW